MNFYADNAEIVANSMNEAKDQASATEILYQIEHGLPSATYTTDGALDRVGLKRAKDVTTAAGTQLTFTDVNDNTIIWKLTGSTLYYGAAATKFTEINNLDFLTITDSLGTTVIGVKVLLTIDLTLVDTTLTSPTERYEKTIFIPRPLSAL